MNLLQVMLVALLISSYAFGSKFTDAVDIRLRMSTNYEQKIGELLAFKESNESRRDVWSALEKYNGDKNICFSFYFDMNSDLALVRKFYDKYHEIPIVVLYNVQTGAWDHYEGEELEILLQDFLIGECNKFRKIYYVNGKIEAELWDGYTKFCMQQYPNNLAIRRILVDSLFAPYVSNDYLNEELLPIILADKKMSAMYMERFNSLKVRTRSWTLLGQRPF